MRRNSGDEEIRKLLRELNEDPTAETAERLAVALRRREEPDPRPEFKCPNCSVGRQEPEGACVLEALAEVVTIRMTDEDDIDVEEAGGKVMEWLSGEDADAWWNSIGPIIDAMEDSVRHRHGMRTVTEWVNETHQIRVYETSSDYQIEDMRTGESRGMSDGVDMFFDDRERALGPGSFEFYEAMAREVADNAAELREAYFGE
jgi:hypothetical protein